MLSFGGSNVDWSSLSQTDKLIFWIFLGVMLVGLVIYYFYDKHKGKGE